MAEKLVLTSEEYQRGFRHCLEALKLVWKEQMKTEFPFEVDIPEVETIKEGE